MATTLQPLPRLTDMEVVGLGQCYSYPSNILDNEYNFKCCALLYIRHKDTCFIAQFKHFSQAKIPFNFMIPDYL